VPVSCLSTVSRCAQTLLRCGSSPDSVTLHDHRQPRPSRTASSARADLDRQRGLANRLHTLGVPQPVAFCGNHDTALAPATGSFRPKRIRRMGYPGSGQTGTGAGLEQRRDDQRPILTTSPAGPFTPARPFADRTVRHGLVDVLPPCRAEITAADARLRLACGSSKPVLGCARCRGARAVHGSFRAHAGSQRLPSPTYHRRTMQGREWR